MARRGRLDDLPAGVDLAAYRILQAGLSPAIEGGGHGLVGMRERVRLYGGQLRAEAGADGGFILDALIPVAAEEGGSA